MQSVTLSHQHRNQLASANHHRSKGLTFSIRQCPDKAFPLRVTINNLSHLREDSGINSVGLRKISHCTGEVTGLPGIDHGNLKTFGLKRTGHRNFQPTSGLHQNQSNGVPSQSGNNRVKAIRVIADCKLSNITAGSDVQCGFGNIDAHTKWIWLTHFYPSLQIRYGIRTTVRVSDEWLGVCASR